MSFTKYFNTQIKPMTKKEKSDLLDKIDLTERQRSIFDMKYRDGKEYACIADFIGVSASVVRDEVRAIKEKIKRVL